MCGPLYADEVLASTHANPPDGQTSLKQEREGGSGLRLPTGQSVRRPHHVRSIRRADQCRNPCGGPHRRPPEIRWPALPGRPRSEEHTSELQSLMRISYAVFCLKTKQITQKHTT